MKLTQDERIVLSDLMRPDEMDVYNRQEIQDLSKRGLVEINECADGDYATITQAGRAALAQGGVNDD